LASLRNDVFDWLVDDEPDVLLNAGLRSRREPRRARVAETVAAKLMSDQVPRTG
jgi:hypothetical protein